METVIVLKRFKMFEYLVTIENKRHVIIYIIGFHSEKIIIINIV